ncbi:MAG: hypothetical protein ACRDR6_27040, partial [Pseudonocardiaceae bacterium]
MRARTSTLGRLATASAAVWTYLLLGRGGFWRTSTRLPADPPQPGCWPSVGAGELARALADRPGG